MQEQKTNQKIVLREQCSRLSKTHRFLGFEDIIKNLILVLTAALMENRLSLLWSFHLNSTISGCDSHN